MIDGKDAFIAEIADFLDRLSDIMQTLRPALHSISQETDAARGRKLATNMIAYIGSYDIEMLEVVKRMEMIVHRAKGQPFSN